MCLNSLFLEEKSTPHLLQVRGDTLGMPDGCRERGRPPVHTPVKVYEHHGFIWCCYSNSSVVR